MGISGLSLFGRYLKVRAIVGSVLRTRSFVAATTIPIATDYHFCHQNLVLLHYLCVGGGRH